MNSSLEELCMEIKKYKTIIIHRHVNPDPDALGSQGGLATLLMESFPEKRILKAGGVPEDLQFLGQMDRISEKDYENALVIITDTGNEPRIDGEADWMKKASKWIKFDHHPNEDHYADLEFVDTNASSSCEVIYEFYAANQSELTLTKKAAYLLYAGLVGDTGRFLFNNTTPRTLEIASHLISFEFDFTELNRHFIEKKEKVARMSGYVEQNFTINEAGVAYIIIDQDLLDQFQVTRDETSSMVGLMGNVEGVKAWGFFIERGDEKGAYRCRLRSKQAPIVDIARRHDGGGHPMASGANAADLKEVHQIIDEMTQLVNQQEVSGQHE